MIVAWRRIDDYDKPTGNLYTPKAVLARLHESYEAATVRDR